MSQHENVKQAVADSKKVRITFPYYLPFVGSREITLPEQGTLAYTAVVAGLVVAEIVEPPIGIVLVVGHMLARRHSHNKTLQAVEEAIGDSEHG